MTGSSPSGWAVGAVVGGAHRLVELDDGRGVLPTWRAEDVRRPGRVLALTPLPPGGGAPAFVRAPHPDVVSLAEVRVHEGARYAVAPWVEGVPLERWLDAFEHRRPPTRVAWRAFARLCALVENVHRARDPMAHGWISPRSLVVTGDAMEAGDRMTLVDLGLADLGARPAWRRFDGVDAWAWVAPERAQGAPSAQGDVFSLAVILAELLTGHPLAVPHEGVTWGRLAASGEAAVLARLRALRPELMGAPIDLVAQALSGDPSRRPPDAAVLRKALRAEGVKLAVERAGTAVLRAPHGLAPDERRPRADAAAVASVATASAPEGALEAPWGATTPEAVSPFEEVFAAEREAVTEPMEARTGPAAVAVAPGSWGGDPFASAEEPVTTPVERGGFNVPGAIGPTLDRTSPAPEQARGPIARTAPMPVRASAVLPAAPGPSSIGSARASSPEAGDGGAPVWALAAGAALLAVAVAAMVYAWMS